MTYRRRLTSLMAVIMLAAFGLLAEARADIDGIIAVSDCETQSDGSCTWRTDFGSPDARDGSCIRLCPASRLGNAALVASPQAGEFVWFVYHTHQQFAVSGDGVAVIRRNAFQRWLGAALDDQVIFWLREEQWTQDTTKR